MTALDRLKTELDPKAWSDDPQEIAPRAADWRGRYKGETPLLIKPGSVEELSKAVAICAEAGIAITPQGGNTSLCGAATPFGEVLVSTHRLNAVREIDPLNDSLTVEAGCVLERVQEIAAEAGRLFPLSLGSQGSAMIGGLISTNAGGVHVLRYGMMRELVLGLEAVLPDGRVWSSLSGLRKDNTGYDLKQLLIGAEGTLGIITAATLKLFPRPASTQLAFIATPDPSRAVELLGLAKEVSGGAVTAFELMPRNALELVVQHVPGARDPLGEPSPWYAVIEMSFGREDGARETLEAALEAGLERELLTDAAIAESETQQKNFWRLRETIAEAEKAHGKAVKHDVSVAVSRMPAFMAEATDMVARLAPEAMVIGFGHVGDGNVHFNIACEAPGAGQDFIDGVKHVTPALYDLVDAHGGSISAEHGIGVLKREDLARRKPLDVEIMKAVKAAVDPQGLMNPRVLLGAD
jgi:FAD/FMN-containing dehydrogenase